MKTIQIVCLSLMTGFFLLSACTKDELEIVPTSNPQNADVKSTFPGTPVTNYANWQEDFATPDALVSRWNLYGTPKPQWVSFAGNRFGLFDNNGRLPNGSYAVSKSKIGNGKGYVIESEVFIDVKNPNGPVICPEIGVTRYLILPTEPQNLEAGLSMKLMYIGKGATNVPPVYHNHTYVVLTALLQDGTIISSGDPKDGMGTSSDDHALLADFAGNGWHKLKIVVSASKQVSFYLDNQFMWTPGKSIHSSLMANKNVLLGFTSPSNTGKAYHDYVKVTYPLLTGQDTVIDPSPTE